MIKIVVVGFGAMGTKTVEQLNKKTTVSVEAVVDTNPVYKGMYTTDYIKGNKQIPIYDSLESVDWEDIDVAIVTSASFLTQIEPLLVELAKKKVNILTIAEEMSYPEVAHAEISQKLNQLALDHNISILGTGINPGFIFDLFIMTLSSTCLDINEIHATRVNNLAEFGETVLKSQGVGLTVKEFTESVKTNEVVGHVGFPQSIHLLAKAFNWELTSLEEEKEPIISKQQVKIEGRVIEKGHVIGCNHKAIAHFKNNKRIKFEHPQQICIDNYPETKDEIEIKGVPNIHLKIEPEIPGGTGTVAMIVNLIPLIIESKPGLLTILDLPRLPTIFNEAEIHPPVESVLNN